MVRTLFLSFVAVVAVGVVATPGLAAAALVLVPLAVLVAVWWAVLGATTHGHRTEAVVRVKHDKFLGPGGADDPFAEIGREEMRRPPPGP